MDKNVVHTILGIYYVCVHQMVHCLTLSQTNANHNLSKSIGEQHKDHMDITHLE